MPATTTFQPILPPTLTPAEDAALRALATPLLSDNMDRLVGATGLNKYHRQGMLVGTALTVRSRPGDNLGMYQALALMQQGHVIVVDAGGDLNNAICGDLMRAYAVSRGCAGFVVDGAIRDVASFANGDFPCYARGVVHRGPYKSGPAFLNLPVSIGGQVVRPGDIVVGDEDGLVFIAPDRLADTIAAAQEKLRAEQAIMAEIEDGAERQSWLHGLLGQMGIQV